MTKLLWRFLNNAILVLGYALLVTPHSAGAVGFAVSVGSAIAPPSTTNAIYALPQFGYTCVTNRYVNATTGSDSNNGQAQSGTGTGPWATITHAESAMAGSQPGLCINVAPSATPYTGGFTTTAFGNLNSPTGLAAVRCAANSGTATAQPALWKNTLGVMGSLPGCQLLVSGGGFDAGIVAFGNGTTQFNYVIVDGFEITSATTTSVNVSALSYNSGTGVVTLTTATSPALHPQMCFTVAGLVGTGSIASANGYFCAAAGTATTTVTYTIATGLTLARTSGGTVTYASGTEVGIGPGPNNVAPGSHHVYAINNYIHDIGGGGLQFEKGDYVGVAGNWVINTSWQNANNESGISIVVSTDFSGTTGVWDGTLGSVNGFAIHDTITNNIFSNNGNLMSGATDGNGIILDSNNSGSQNSCTVTSYSFGSLIYGNVVYDNGGRGIHAFYSSRVAILNNTVYNNNQSDITATQANFDSFCGSSNLLAYNISVAVTGSGTLASNYAMGGLMNSNLGTGNAFHQNMLNVIGTLTLPGPLGARGNGYSAWNGLDTGWNPALTTTSGSPSAAWSSGTTYASQNPATGTDGNIYVSIAGSNTNHNPLTDTTNCTVSGTFWQCDGLPDNIYPQDPLFNSAAPYVPPDLRLQVTSSALGASAAAVTALGGPVTSTPNIGAF